MGMSGVWAAARIGWLAAGLCISLPFAAKAIQAPFERAFEDGVALTRAGRYDEALVQFLAAEKAGDQSARLYFNLGVVHYRLQHFEAARAAFARAAEDSETADLAQYNSGLVALAAGDNQEAARWFRRVAGQAGEPGLRALARRALDRAVGKAADTVAARGSLSVLRGWDSNVVVPVGSISDLPSSRRDQFTEARLAWAGALGGAVPGLGYRFAGLAIEYDDIQPGDIAALEAGIDWRGPILIDAGVGVLAVGDNEYQSSLDVRLQAPLIEVDSVRVSVDGGWSRLNPMDDRANGLEGSRYSFGASVEAGNRPLSVNFGYRHLINDRFAASLSPDQDRYSLRLRLALDRWIVRAWGRYMGSHYPTQREDQARDIGIDAAFRLHARWELLVEANRLQNRSSDSRFNYTTERLYSGLRFYF
jgi:tetratricopeptide (TPR) repeat protein